MKINWRSLFAKTAMLSLLAGFFVMPAVAQTTDGPYPDVPADDPDVQEIIYMQEQGVFTGYPDGTFQPDRVLNRAEQLKVYMLIHGMDPDAAKYKNCFPDVKDEWFAKYICFAKAQGWVEGYPDGTFKPAQEVNRVEALKMLGQIQGWVMTEPTENPFTDTPFAEWYAKYVEYAKTAGLTVEKGGNFHPGSGLTRSETAVLLFKSLAVYALGEESYDKDLDDQILAIDVDLIIPPVTMDDDVVVAEAEYGDAPENGVAGYAGSYSTVEAAFPTLYSTVNSSYGPGAHALDSSQEWLGDPNAGDSYSLEVDADDSADPDGVTNLTNTDDFDDGVTGLNVMLTQIPPPATLSVDVTVETGAPEVPRYLNAVIDLNMDGSWKGNAAGGEPEWIVKNYVVNVAPGSTESVTSDAFAYSNGMLLTPTSWMRVVLSRSPIDAGIFGADGWDGSGEFDYGEVEDYYVQLPNWNLAGGGVGGGAGGPGAGGRGLIWGKPAPVMVCPSNVKFPKKANSVIFSCGIYNYGGTGDTTYNLWRISGLVDVWRTTRVVKMPTAPPGFFAAGFPGGAVGVMGNPTREWFVATNRAGTPSTWNYKIEGVDSESTVSDSIVNLGLVAADKDKGYGAEDSYTLDDFLFWSAEVDDTYLIDPEKSGPSIVDVAFFEMNDAAVGQHHYSVLADVRDVDTAEADLDFSWSSPANCGIMETAGSQMDWYFTNADKDECLGNGLTLEVSDGINSISEDFFDIFVDLDLAEAPAVNTAPVINGLEAVWLNAIVDDPHLYDLYLDASDADGDSLTYNWVSVTCGELTAGTDTAIARWEYPLADMEACGSATVTVEVSDGTDSDVEILSIF